MKKISLLFFTLVLALTMFSMPASASYRTIGVLTYSYNDDHASVARCKENASGALTISSTIEGKPVTGIMSEAFCNCYGLTSVSIPDSVTSIGESAFHYCSGLTSVSIGKGVKTIGFNAFSHCIKLTSVTIPDSVTSIGAQAFSGCSGLTSVSIPNGVTCIGYDTFYNCSGLTSVSIPDSVTSIGQLAFYYCSGLTSVSIPDSVTSIGHDAFYGCSGLTSVTLSNNLTTIEENIFGSCHRLRSIAIPDKVTSIGSGAFSVCERLTSVSIPDSVTNIGNGAFSGCERLTSVSIPDSVTSIGNGVFRGCTGLTSIIIPDSITSIGEEAFSGCSGLTSVTIPNSVITIGTEAFFDCTGLKTITIPKNVTSFGYDVFNTIGLTIYGSTGSKAEEYANINGFNFIDLTTIVDSVSVNPASLNLTKGNTATIQAIILPTTAINKTVSWASSNSSVATVDNSGKVTAVGNGSATITATSVDGNKTATCSVTVTGGSTPEPTPTPTVSFNDVKTSDYFYDAVNWAVANNVTTGVGGNKFAPSQTCTRGQTVTFLWRAAGCPEPTGSSNPFTDVKSSDYFYKAVLWAVGKNVTTGTSNTTFSPNQGCTRGQVVTFLWRANGQPKVSANNPFSDVKAGAYYYTAVLWAVNKNITKGTSSTAFSPNATCIRGQIVTFLYRNYN